MKINKTIFFAFFSTLLCVFDVVAQTTPGEPCVGCPPNRPDMPIDQNIVYLMGAALVLGVVMIYKNKIKKASV
ncbi:MAG TPA: hypothetical protein VJ304_14075 [Flavobacterium sp.]|nr:hypothetical protein [Flavobacterium sp.]